MLSGLVHFISASPNPLTVLTISLIRPLSLDLMSNDLAPVGIAILRVVSEG